MGNKSINEGHKPQNGNFGYRPVGGQQNGYQPPSQTKTPSNPPSGGSGVNPPKK